ncbi:NAD(P)/FAD-dependent oxidoreductase [Kordiimonas sp.]|uniref:NAD(P)/FAD-dependent oxidoreductase n=1 Tax=Kordiimonas sp. TaxID=1970157 RepID=UPI003A8E1E4D
MIGSGIAGLSAAWLLSKNQDVTLFEKSGYIGGHAHTVDITLEDKKFPVDTGFIVFNPVNYPNLTALFEHLQVTTDKTDMSFAVSLDDGAFEYSGGDGGGLLAQPSNILKPRFWAMLQGIVRFYGKAEHYCSDPSFTHMSLGELLATEGYRSAFIRDHLAPMGAAIWSSNSADILDYPAADFLNFFRNHGLVQLSNRPEWRTVRGGSRQYIQRLTSSFRNNIRVNCAVQSVARTSDGVRVLTSDGRAETYNEVIFACHSDQALRLIEEPAPDLRHSLTHLGYSANTVVLHTDETLMPQRKKAWASWNYIERRMPDAAGPAVSYWMNRLQNLPVQTPIIVTLNPDREIKPENILGEYEYDHPIFDQQASIARRQLWQLQGRHHMWFAGAYLGHGFHEDGIQAGLTIAELLGSSRRPWFRSGQNERIGQDDTAYLPRRNAA